MKKDKDKNIKEFLKIIKILKLYCENMIDIYSIDKIDKIKKNCKGVIYNFFYELDYGCGCCFTSFNFILMELIKNCNNVLIELESESK